MPKAIASIYIYPLNGSVSVTYDDVFSSINKGTVIFTFSSLRSLIF